jgi:hypothetical protein
VRRIWLTLSWPCQDYLSYRIVDNKNLTIKTYILLAIAVCFGLLSHYYYVIWNVLVSSILVLWLIYEKRYGDIKKFIIFSGIGVFLNLILWHYAISSIFSSRGGSGVEKLLGLTDFSKRFLFFKQQASVELFGIEVNMIIVILLLAGILFFIKAVKYAYANNILSNDANGKNIIIKSVPFYAVKSFFNNSMVKVIIALSGILYITIISVIAEQTEARYIYSIYPVIIVLFIVIIDRILSYIFKVKNAPVDKQNSISKNKTLVFLIIFIVIFGFYNKKQYLEYFYPIDTAEIASMYKDSQFIIVSLNEGWIFVNTVVFASQNNKEGYAIYVSSYKDIEEKLLKPLRTLDRSKEVIIYISIAYSDTQWVSYWRPNLLKEQIVKDKVFEVLKKEGFTKPRFLFSGFCFEAYRFSYNNKK